MDSLGSTIRAMKANNLAEVRQFIISANNITHLQNLNLDNSVHYKGRS